MERVFILFLFDRVCGFLVVFDCLRQVGSTSKEGDRNPTASQLQILFDVRPRSRSQRHEGVPHRG